MNRIVEKKLSEKFSQRLKRVRIRFSSKYTRVVGELTATG